MDLTDNDKASLVWLVSMMRQLKSPTVTTTQAGRILGCKKDKVLELVRAGLLSGYRLPSARSKQRLLKPVKGTASDAEPSRDPRHHRIPTICVLLTVAREWLDGFQRAGFRPSHEEALQLIGPMIMHLPLPHLKSLGKLISNRIADREEQLATVMQGVPKRGPRSKQAQEQTPTLL